MYIIHKGDITCSLVIFRGVSKCMFDKSQTSPHLLYAYESGINLLIEHPEKKQMSIFPKMSNYFLMSSFLKI